MKLHLVNTKGRSKKSEAAAISFRKKSSGMAYNIKTSIESKS
jgi:hypothetical protein